MNRTDRTGQRFGSLTVLYKGANDGRFTVWICACDCSPYDKFPVKNAELMRRKDPALSCGCLPLVVVANRSKTLELVRTEAAPDALPEAA